MLIAHGTYTDSGAFHICLKWNFGKRFRRIFCSICVYRWAQHSDEARHLHICVESMEFISQILITLGIHFKIAPTRIHIWKVAHRKVKNKIHFNWDTSVWCPKINWCFCCSLFLAFIIRITRYNHCHLHYYSPNEVFALSVSLEKFKCNADLHSQKCIFFWTQHTVSARLPTAVVSAEIPLLNSNFQSNNRLHRCTLWLWYVCCRMCWAFQHFSTRISAAKSEIDIESANLMRCFYLRLFVIKTHKYTLCSSARAFCMEKMTKYPSSPATQHEKN